VLAGIGALLLHCGRGPAPAIDYSGPTAIWPEYAGSEEGLHYSPLTQITRENVGQLELAWTHRSGDFFHGSAERAATSFQATPLVVNDLLYYCTPHMRVFALDPETGAERWRFDPVLRNGGPKGPYPLACRGVSYWEAPQPEPGASCQKRILYGTRDSELIALDADTGAPCADFGNGGRVPLREGIGAEVPEWEYYPTSPPLVLGDIAVIGALVADQLRSDAPSGVVRAFDVRSGKRLWGWDPVPPGWSYSARPADEDWARGTPNVWSLLSGDAERGLVFVPVGNAPPDSYGGNRRGLDYYSSSVVALRLATGEPVWRYQTVHHDIWDFDVPSQPELIQIPTVGGGRPAVVQSTKMGFVFILDRETGEPLYPTPERPVPQSGVPGETLSPTQPFPTHPKPLHPEDLSPESMYGFTPIDRASCQELVKKYRWDGFYTPPSLEGSLQFPHTSGGMNWGGLAIDPTSGLMIVNQTHVAVITQLIPRAEFDQIDLSSVHYPQEYYPMAGTPYGVKRFPLLSRFGAPCNQPPWGSLTAVDLASGEVAWRVPFGTVRDQAPVPIWLLPWWSDLGAPNFGGGILTASGAYFVGATTDRYFRAFDAKSGEEIWRTRIPYTGNASPMSFRLSRESKQYVVLAAGGNPLTEPGDALLAFRLAD
jgi:quinoprotein glucose dehydrogenase